jgi:hypothetical protein
MRSAREQAETFLNSLNLSSSIREAAFDVLVLRFKEHARDQRFLCAESVPYEGVAPYIDPNPLVAHADALTAAHAAVMNAPEPGKPQQ